MRFKTLATCLPFLLSACQFSCSSLQRKSPHPPSFNADRAYEQILKYEEFGPKIPGSTASTNAGNWIVQELKTLGLTVYEQNASGTTWEKKQIPIRNIIGQFNKNAKERILLSAHWDNRPYADEEPLPFNRKFPVPGVNDGGSGVVVLLQIAAALADSHYPLGVDFLFLDAEDLGHPSSEDSYCLGTQVWAKNPIPENYVARYGINFDMVGREGAIFPVERFSKARASTVIEKMHLAAKQIGFESFFPKFEVGPITDDHVYLMQGRGFPVMDVIHMTEEGRFPPEWHTRFDNSKVISKETLKAVGQTTLQVLWNEE